MKLKLAKRYALLTWKDDKELTSEDGEQEDDKEDLSFVILFDRFEGHPSHEAFKVDRFFQHAPELSLKRLFHSIFYHLNGSLATFGDGGAARALEEERAHSSG